MKYKVGDVVRVKSREWFNAQEKDADGDITLKYFSFTVAMNEYYGRSLKVTDVHGDYYSLESCDWYWQDWMLEDDEVPDINGLADEILAYPVAFLLDGKKICQLESISVTDSDGNTFNGFRIPPKPPEKKKRPMTRDEVLYWACSQDALGWVVRIDKNGAWFAPAGDMYYNHIHNYQRAKITPQGVDESTIQGFEVEE